MNHDVEKIEKRRKKRQEYYEKYYSKNREKIKEINKNYYLKNKESIRIKNSERYRLSKSDNIARSSLLKERNRLRDEYLTLQHLILLEENRDSRERERKITSFIDSFNIWG